MNNTTTNRYFETSTLKRWLSIIILAIATFTIVTAELAPIGLLTPMAEDDAFPASAIYVAIFNSATGTGALFGAWIMANFDFTVLMSFSGTAIVISLFMISIIPSNINDAPSQLVGDNL